MTAILFRPLDIIHVLSAVWKLPKFGMADTLTELGTVAGQNTMALDDANGESAAEEYTIGLKYRDCSEYVCIPKETENMHHTMAAYAITTTNNERTKINDYCIIVAHGQKKLGNLELAVGRQVETPYHV